jgi:hypothetical protein
VVANLSDVLNLAALNYTYDALEPVPGGGQVLVAAAVPRRGEKVRAASGRIALSQSAVQAPLAPAAAAPGAQRQSLAAHADSLDANGRMYLVVRDLQTDVPPNTLYGLYLDLPPNSTVEQKKEHAVGAFNFFHAHPSQGAGHAAMATAHTAAASFDVTSLVQNLRKAGKLSANPILTVIPIGKPNAAAKPVVGDISIIEV